MSIITEFELSNLRKEINALPEKDRPTAVIKYIQKTARRQKIVEAKMKVGKK